MVRTTVTFSILVMRGSHRVRLVMTCRSSWAMHRAGDDWNSGAAQRRNPRREENYGQVDGEQSAHHGCQSTAIDSRRNIRQKPRHHENQESKAQLQHCRAAETGGSAFVHKLWVHSTEIVRRTYVLIDVSTR